jgi:phenylpyruvate tautomerase PptA (4-oxalocrotonate tautomerase family)
LVSSDNQEGALPMIDLTYSVGALSPEGRERAVELLTSALLQHEGAPDSPYARAMTWVVVHEMPAGALNVGGGAIGVPLYRVEVTVPAGTLLGGPGPVGAESRRNLVRAVTDALLEAEGGARTSADAARVYCVIREIEDGFWGALGTTWRMEEIAAIATGRETGIAGDARGAIDSLLERVAAAP